MFERRNVSQPMNSNAVVVSWRNNMSHCGMRMRIMIPILVLLLVLLLFPIVVVDGRRHTDDRTSSSSSSSSFVRPTPRKLPMTVTDADHRVPTTTIPSTTNDESSRDDMVNSDVTVFDKSNHHNSTFMESSTSKTITRVTPTSLIVNDDDDDDDDDATVVSPILNVPRHSTDIYTIDHPNSEIDDDDDIKPLDEESVIRLRYHRTNSIDHRNHDDDDDEHKHGFFHRSRTSTTSTKDIAMSFPPLQTPIVYRYYPRQPHASSARTRSTGGTTIPFVLLGPHVDHWKSVAQALSLCGFHVIAVGPKDPVRHIHNNDDVPTTTTDTNNDTKQPPPVPYELGLSSVLTSSNDSHNNNNNNNNDRYLEGPGLVLQLLDALRWKKIILVGCDCEAAWAVQAALLLPPDRIAGLIICGNLHECERIFVESYSTSSSTSTRSSSSPFELDRFLQERLSCPFTIVWDGTNDKTTVSSSSSSSTMTIPLDSIPIGMSSKSSTNAGSSNNHCSHRSVIIGGGTSPHRRRPGIFAWILTRFVEERIAPAVSIPASSTTTTRTSATRTAATSRIPGTSPDTTTLRFPVWLSAWPIWKLPSRIPVLWNVDDMFNEESMVVFGRIVATAIFYAISLKVLVYQYGNIRDVIDVVTSTPRHIISIVQHRISNIATFLLFIGRIPFMIIPFGKRISHSTSNETRIEKDALISSKNDPPEDQSENSEDGKDDPEKSESTTEKDLRPFFFLDHVVA